MKQVEALPLALIPELLPPLPVGRFVRLAPVAPMGSLVARRQRDGEVALYWRHGVAGRSFRTRLGVLNTDASSDALDLFNPRLSLDQALRQAARAAQETYPLDPCLNPRPPRLLRAGRAEPEDYPAGSLGRILLAYAREMQQAGRPSAVDIRSCLDTHVIRAAPELARRPAQRISRAQWAVVLARPEQQGRLRTAQKLRSHLRSAYAAAGLPAPAFAAPGGRLRRTAHVTHAAAVATDPALALARLRAYWAAIATGADFRFAILRLHLLLGAPKLAPFLRLLNGDVSARQLSLLDRRGRVGGAARPLDLPLLPVVARELAAVRSLGVYALSTTEGRSPISTATFSAWMAQALDVHPALTPARVRADVASALAQAGVSLSARQRLFSSGIKGAQSRPWDGRGFMDEKRRALDTLWREIRRTL